MVISETVRRVYGRSRFEQAIRKYAEGQSARFIPRAQLAAAFGIITVRNCSARASCFPLLIDGERVSVAPRRARPHRCRGPAVRERAGALAAGER